MLIYAIDDEQAMLEELHDAIAAAEPDAEIRDFRLAKDLLAALASGPAPDVVFSDIRLPGMDGLNLAVQIKNRAPHTKIIFVTGYSQYALEAYKRHIHGYVMKPVDASRIREELDALDLPESPSESDKLRIQCFGHFEVFRQDKPLVFSRAKAKELLAYLVDREGAYCSIGEIINALWEDGKEGNNPKHYLRVLSSDLANSLGSVGMRDLLLKRRGQLAVDTEKLDCDYYRMRHGDAEAVNAYHGEYMVDYSWAELTGARLHFRK